MKRHMLYVCQDCHPPTGVEQKTIGIFHGHCHACGKQSEGPDLVAYGLHDVLGRLEDLERRETERKGKQSPPVEREPSS